MRIIYSGILFLTFTPLILFSQGVYNNGGKLSFPSGIYVHLLSGDFTNTTYASSDGEITMGGSFYLKGDWINNSLAALDLEGGTVIFNGSSKQQIKGTDYTEFYNLTVNSGGDVEVPSGHYLTVQNNLSISGQLALKSSSNNQTASLIDGASDGGSNSGNLTVERYLDGSTKYHYISSPVHNATYSDLYDANNGGYNIYYYDETNNNTDKNIGWTAQWSGTLTNAKGYAVVYTAAKTLEFENTLNTASDIGITVSKTSSGNNSADGWNLIGNPFPSPLIADSFIAANTAIDGTLYFWDDDGSQGSTYTTSDYASYNNLGGTAATGGGQQATPNGTISIGQAFFVKKTASGSSTLYFKNAHRTHHTGSQFFIPEPGVRQRIKISLSNDSGLYNEILIGFLEGATNGHDRLYDGEKLKGNPLLAFYSINNQREYVIQGLPWLDGQPVIIPLGVDVAKGGGYAFQTVFHENFLTTTTIVLEDRDKGQLYDMTLSAAHPIYIGPGVYQDRFFLHFNHVPGSIDKPENPDIKLMATRQSLIISCPGRFSGALQLYDLLGKRLVEKNLTFEGTFKLNHQLSKGMYVVRLSNSGIRWSEIFMVP